MEENGNQMWVLMIFCFGDRERFWFINYHPQLIRHEMKKKKRREREREKGINLKVVEVKLVGAKKAEEEEEIETLKF